MFATARLYGALAVGMMILGLVVFAGWQYDQAKLARKDAAAALAAMTQLQEGLTQLHQGQVASDTAIQGMSQALLQGSQRATTVARRVVNMGKQDATIQKWLDSPLPVGGCMLDDTCGNGSPASAAQRSPVVVVRPASAGAVAR